ncbi:MAG: hypothetical protein AB1515_09410 [Nitrospirota bacterium]
MIRTITCLLAIISLAGCAHSRRMAEVNAFEAGYFQLVTRGAYEDAYAQLHSDVKAAVTPERYKAFFDSLIDALGPMGGWEKVPGVHDQHIPLLERERRRDPLPPDNPQAAVQSRYRVKFGETTATFLIRTGWEGDRMTIRNQVLCCMDQKTLDAVLARAEERGVAELFTGKPRDGAPADGANPPAP